LPAWLLRSCSYELADIVAHIVNCSFSTGKVPSYWLNALVTPVPKVSACIVFFRFLAHLSYPHLSRIAEKVIVRRWLQPAIPVDNILDKFAFKPSGSTTTVLVYFIHQLTKMLEQNDYVRCLINRLYLLKPPRHQGLPDAQLSVIANAVIISRLLYARPTWGGFLSVELVKQN